MNEPKKNPIFVPYTDNNIFITNNNDILFLFKGQFYSLTNNNNENTIITAYVLSNEQIQQSFLIKQQNLNFNSSQNGFNITFNEQGIPVKWENATINNDFNQNNNFNNNNNNNNNNNFNNNPNQNNNNFNNFNPNQNNNNNLNNFNNNNSNDIFEEEETKGNMVDLGVVYGFVEGKYNNSTDNNLDCMINNKYFIRPIDSEENIYEVRDDSNLKIDAPKRSQFTVNKNSMHAKKTGEKTKENVKYLTEALKNMVDLYITATKDNLDLTGMKPVLYTKGMSKEAEQKIKTTITEYIKDYKSATEEQKALFKWKGESEPLVDIKNDKSEIEELSIKLN